MRRVPVRYFPLEAAVEHLMPDVAVQMAVEAEVQHLALDVAVKQVVLEAAVHDPVGLVAAHHPALEVACPVR